MEIQETSHDIYFIATEKTQLRDMGVPKFFRWVTSRYPATLSDEIISGNHGSFEFDNLYLDMNGIIHGCSHNDRTILQPSLSFDEIMHDICQYLDHIVTRLVQPLKLMYIAVDGVAPRCKLNQQRSRRFRSAYDTKHAMLTKMKGNSKSHVTINELFDSNCITPGTEFMWLLSIRLKEFIGQRMKENTIWNRLEVYFSGAEVPGEGEHKVSDPSRPPNYVHQDEPLYWPK